MNHTKMKPYLYALFANLAFFLNNELIYKDWTQASNPFYIGVIPLTFCFILFAKMFQNNAIKNTSTIKRLFCLLLAFFMVMGNSYLKINSWNLVFGSVLMLFISIIEFLGYFLVFSLAMNKIDDFIEKYIKKNKDIKLNDKYKKIFDEKPFWKIFFIIIGFWLIYIIAFYPIVMSPDPTTQMLQYYNLDNKYASSTTLLDDNMKLTNHHPIIHTLFLGSCLELGNNLGNQNIGLFVYTFIQVIIMASIYAYSIVYMKKLKTPYILRICVLTIYSLVPMFPLFSVAAVKDTLYTGFILLFSIFIFDILKFYQKEKISIQKALFLFLLSSLICLFRNNGVFIIVFSLPFLIIKNKNNCIRLTVLLISVVSLYTCYNHVVLPYFKITPGSIRETLSIPFQQVARYVKKYGNTLTDKEINTIDKVLDYSDLAERYNPVFADSVKDKFRKATTDEDLKDFFALWSKLLLKHPDVYIQATMNNVYGYFYPHSIRWYLYYKYNPYNSNYGYEAEVDAIGLGDLKFNSPTWIRKGISAVGVSWPYIPIVGLLANVGFNTWCTLFMAMTFIHLRKRKFIIPLIPMLTSILICIASPVNTYFRYTMPFVFLVPFMWSIFVYVYKDKDASI